MAENRKVKARDDDGNPICGAKTRKGGVCKNPPMPNGRCRMHGGATPPPPKGVPSGALKHGIYSKFLTPEEQELTSHIELGKVDAELVMCRIRLHRIMSFEQRTQSEQNDLLLEEVKDKTTTVLKVGGDEGAESLPGIETTTTRRRYDFEDAVDRLLRRIESLEKTRFALMGEGGTEADAALDELLDELDD
ncbi:hypothetical protein NFC81_09130 [Salinispirillum sp. LH 10-3-1]|uniref:Terminase small subunit n=1 Tax=Salinispirillum sp. LH 10-3-1 TaxID=2952525 RepID=A0AB38YCT6_9GAMM